MNRRIISIILLMLLAVSAGAQEAQPEMADALRSNGKIYVVVFVLATIFAGILAYLIRLDRKISKIEQNK